LNIVHHRDHASQINKIKGSVKSDLHIGMQLEIYANKLFLGFLVVDMMVFQIFKEMIDIPKAKIRGTLTNCANLSIIIIVIVICDAMNSYPFDLILFK